MLESHDDLYAARLKQADQEAFQMIYRIYCVRLYNFAFKFLKNKELSEEVVQESFLNLWLNREKLNENYPVGPYLFSIGKRMTLNSLKHFSSSKAGLEKLWQSITYSHNETEEAIEMNNLIAFAEIAFSNLPAQQQLVFRLSREEGLTYEEIADKLQISKNTVRNHLVAALKNLKVQFAQSDIVYLVLLLTLIYHQNF